MNVVGFDQFFSTLIATSSKASSTLHKMLKTETEILDQWYISNKHTSIHLTPLMWITPLGFFTTDVQA